MHTALSANLSGHVTTTPCLQRTKWGLYLSIPVFFGYVLARSPTFLEALKDWVSGTLPHYICCTSTSHIRLIAWIGRTRSIQTLTWAKRRSGS